MESGPVVYDDAAADEEEDEEEETCVSAMELMGNNGQSASLIYFTSEPVTSVSQSGCVKFIKYQQIGKTVDLSQHVKTSEDLYKK